MRNRLSGSVLTLLILAAPAAADDLTGQQVFLCAAAQAALCTDYGDCDTFAPWDLNIPQFIEVNLKDKTLSTTKASGENRSTPIRNMAREDGQIVLQGVEAGRAFSFVINEKSGMMSVAVAREGKAVAVFGACTPMPAPAPTAK
jgi:hypothetical protein